MGFNSSYRQRIMYIQNYFDMQSPGKDLLKALLSRAATSNCFQEALSLADRCYQIKPYNILKLNPPKVLEIYLHIKVKFYNSNSVSQLDSWHENELRIFTWVLVIYSHLEDKRIEAMDGDDWDYFSQIFNGKSPNTFQFQALCLVRRRKSKKWGAEEIKLLVSIIGSKSQKNKWNQIAKAMFTDSQKKYFRTPKQCREQWINHLDPSKTRSEWTSVEDYLMIKAVISAGKKWSFVARELGNRRTEHMVKNRFKSLLNAEMKKVGDEEDEGVVVLKIKQRLEANSLVKKYLNKGLLPVKSKRKNNEEEYLPTCREAYHSEEIESFSSSSDSLDSQATPIQRTQDPSGVLSPTVPHSHEPTVVLMLPEEELKCLEEIGEQREQLLKIEESWVWRPDPQEDLNLDKFLRHDSDHEPEEELNNFFTPTRSVSFRFDF